tara:strand:- start:87 stop:1028 length:942 start_codon:yes stop_codon:yes gene_type:complete
MTSKIIVNNIGSDTGINTVTFDSNLQRGTSNLHSTGLNVSDTFLHSTGLNVGTGATIHQPADNVMTLGTNGSERLRIESGGDLKISNDIKSSDDDFYVYSYKGGSDGQVRAGIQYDGTSERLEFFAGTTEKLRIASSGQIGIAGANYGTAGQVLTSQGSGSSVQWASPSNPTLAHAFVFMDSQYFTSSVTLLEFNNSTTNDRSSGVTITRGGSERFTPTVAGVYFVQAHLTYSHGGGTYTPVLHIYRNGSSYSSLSSSNIVSYGGGHNDSLSCQAMMTFNGTSDYVDMRASHNGGGNATMKSYSTFAMFRVGA